MKGHQKGSPRHDLFRAPPYDAPSHPIYYRLLEFKIGTINVVQGWAESVEVGDGSPTAKQKDVVIRYQGRDSYWKDKAEIDNLIFAIIPDASVWYQKLRASWVAIAHSSVYMPMCNKVSGYKVHPPGGHIFYGFSGELDNRTKPEPKSGPGSH
ncbi:hypothetical protein [Parasedimentitalea maritima]|uniref:Uncharacterized protein n=1 Tax=Parasedimentitalea maritima TaxID=2578117 RepID=A0A6A4RLP5_9RHOB|nr:hypothetical protein [Zongyanglinia marina]KAE9632835.1 hypothetical protein GP644_03430 [Zongyanglinia marina]